jgi:hypothetical protein
MKRPAENPREAVDRFLGTLGEPLPPPQVERAIARVRNRLDEAESLSVSVDTPRPAKRLQWSAVAAAVLVMLVGGAVQLSFLRPEVAGRVAKTVSGQIYVAESYRPLYIASRIEGGQLVRAGSQGGTVALFDGSRIEMSPQSELSIVHASDGMRVHLDSGTVIVTAAKQRDGHLYVETRDLLVSVVGTVFSVSAETVGSRVSVIEGEVHVQQGGTVQTLLPGQQASTSPALGPLPVETQLGWSKSAGELAVLLQQSAPAVAALSPAPVSQAARVIQGTVKLANKQEGIPGVTVTACLSNYGRLTVGRSVNNAGVTEEIAFVRRGEPEQNASIIRNKTFFYALFYGAIGCRTPIQGKTDAMGHFQLQDVVPGEYAVRAELEGHFGWAVNGTYPAYASQQITVDAQQPLPDVSLALVRGGTISGRVRDAEGKLLVNTQVSAVMAGAINGAFTTLSSKTTDDRGEYRLFGLPPGEYYVAAGARGTSGYANAVGGNVLRYFSNWSAPPGQPASMPGQTFFPSATATNDATAIVLKEGEEVPGIEIVVRPPLPTDAPVTPAPVLRR